MNNVQTIQDRIREKALREADRLLDEMHSRWDSELMAIAAYASSLHVAAYDDKQGKEVTVRMDTLTRSLKKSLRTIVAQKLEDKFTAEFFAKVESLREGFDEMQEYIGSQPE